MPGSSSSVLRIVPTPERAASEAVERGAKVEAAISRSASFFRGRQLDSGAWQGECEWCSMIAAQFVIAHTITGRPMPDGERDKLIQYFSYEQHDDGSWGLHPAADGYVFNTGLAYVALRLLGLSASDERCARARRWIDDHGGIRAVPSWGKIWLATLGLYGWDGINPVPPELWLVPEASPIHPSRFYCHTRLIYLGISALYGTRFAAGQTPILGAIRRELWGVGGYERADWDALRHEIASTDVFVRPPFLLRRAYDMATRVLPKLPTTMRTRALKRVYEHIRFELRSTRYACISPVNGLLNIVALYARDPHDPDIDEALGALHTWRWEAPESGARYNGANSHSWDTAFTAQAAVAGPGAAEMPEALARAYGFFERTQLLDELEGGAEHYRAPRRGGWCFSDDFHMWPVSDTTAEALVALAQLEAHPAVAAKLGSERVGDDRQRLAIEFVLRRQNPEGGFGSYEKRRGSLLLETVNPSEMYGSCMTERSYVECTASCVKALAFAREHLPVAQTVEGVDAAIRRGVAFLRKAQNTDGSWPGVWAVNFTYGTLFALEALIAAGVSPRDPVVQRAVRWYVRAQRSDGGWGENWKSSLENRYIESDSSQMAQTAWSLMALLLADAAKESPEAQSAVERGIDFLLAHQRQDGTWPRQDPTGVFFHTAFIEYELYKDIFPFWALNSFHASLTRDGHGLQGTA